MQRLIFKLFWMKRQKTFITMPGSIYTRINFCSFVWSKMVNLLDLNGLTRVLLVNKKWCSKTIVLPIRFGSILSLKTLHIQDDLHIKQHLRRRLQHGTELHEHSIRLVIQAYLSSSWSYSQRLKFSSVLSYEDILKVVAEDPNKLLEGGRYGTPSRSISWNIVCDKIGSLISIDWIILHLVSSCTYHVKYSISSQKGDIQMISVLGIFEI